jgi:PiT family inorganic phosphate transporter
MPEAMPDMLTITILTIAVALIFDFFNGFNDAANSIATIIATRVLKYWQAVCWAAFFNFAAYFVISAGVAKMIGGGLIDLQFVTPEAVLSGLLGGVIWHYICWRMAMPVSSSHMLISGYAGAVAASMVLFGDPSQLTNAFYASAWIKVLAFILIAPVVGYILAYGVMWLTQKVDANHGNSNRTIYKVFQLFSSAFLSLMHGANDAQKIAGIIAGALVAGGQIPADDFHVPEWVLFICYLVIALGTLAGGWRVIKTMGFKLTKLRPMHGFSAETGAALSIGLATWLHIPISSTLTITGAVVGVGAARDKAEVKWNMFHKIALMWVVTLPATFVLGAFMLLIVHVVS